MTSFGEDTHTGEVRGSLAQITGQAIESLKGPGRFDVLATSECVSSVRGGFSHCQPQAA